LDKVLVANNMVFESLSTVSSLMTGRSSKSLSATLGSGIALFVAYNNKLGLNVSVTLDSNFTTINWFILDTDYLTLTTTTYNATLYNKQNMFYGDHVLNVVLQDYQGNQSDIMFDYAAVTGVRLVPSQSYT
jgi:hypothetical protein